MIKSAKHIALVCPGGPVTRELAEKTASIAAARFGDSVKLHFHDQCFSAAGHFAGSDAERSAAFLEVANDPRYDAVWFARGGYGACRFDEALFAKLNDHARKKTYLGYSDNGMLLARLYNDGIGRPVHGPIPADLPREGGEEAIARALAFLVEGDASGVEPTARSGKKCAAFNITILAHLSGTDWMPDLSGHIVMLEDVGEYLYRTDRALFSIMGDKNVHNAEGIMLGRLSDIPENDRPFGASEEEVIKYWCARAGVPYLGRADIGHDGQNKIVPFGAAPVS
ncbi:LD-carboxypeptidase [Hyphococcus luteus]|uniref:LD-carboxypeptidase n=1 Tax=Hyphococcus luteus TaxID=2058213 RepID=A0A2S7K7V5_9PROT|nr:LD-carboxypeptidase [Marinicaulis flavus]PQA88580.1 LD-carboxypeptidase [Marinicaulis flavus]